MQTYQRLSKVPGKDFLLFLTIFVAGIIYIHYTWTRIESERNAEVLQLAQSIETVLSRSDIAALKGSPQDLTLSEYQTLKARLMDVISVNNKARFAYLYILRNGKIYFLADSEPVTSPDYSPPGQEYTEAKEIYKIPFTEGREVVTTPSEDRWGRWISVLIPVKLKDSHQVSAVFAMDFDASKWNSSLIFEVLQSSLLTLLLLLTFLFVYRIRVKNVHLQKEISERRRFEEELLNSEQQKAAILKAMPDMLFIFDREGYYREIYTEDDSRLILPRRELIGKNLRELFSEEMVHSSLEAFSRAAVEKRLVQYSYSIPLEDHTEYFEARIVPALNDQLLMIVRDITERVRVQELQTEGQRRSKMQRNAIARIALNEEVRLDNFHKAIEFLIRETTIAINVERASIWMLSADGTNLRCTAMYERSGKQYSSGIVLRAEEYPHYFRTIRSESRISAEDAQNDPRTSEFTDIYLRPNNITSMLDAGVYVNGELKGIVCLEHVGRKRTWHSDEESFATTIAAVVAQIITNNNRKEAENVLHDIIAQNPISVQIIDKEGYTLSTNQAFAGIFTDTPAPDYSFFKDPQLIGSEFEQLINRLKEGEIVHFPDFTYQTKSNTVWIQMVAFPLRSNNGEIERFVLMHENITARKTTERELMVAKEHAEESDRLKSAFLANMSHEIRTPMNGILGFAELLKERNLSEETQQEYIKIIEDSGTRMLNIINNIVDISKIESGQMEIDIQPSDINEHMDYIYQFFKPEVEKKGMMLQYQKALPDSEAVIDTDSEKLYAILTNLVKNAIKYSDRGRISFGYQLQEDASKNHKFVEFYVKDTGIGIQKEKQMAIFERFIQANISDKASRQGAGLGLAITKAYVEMLGGTVWVESEEGVGSSFFFTLPYTAKQPTTNSEPMKVELTTTTATEVANLKILVVEDDETSAKLISMVVRKFSRETLRAKNGREAVEICRDNPDIDLVLMDIQMPEMNGFEATEAIRTFNTDIVIVAQTANAFSDDKERAMALGFNDFLSKPIDRVKVEAVIAEFFS